MVDCKLKCTSKHTVLTIGIFSRQDPDVNKEGNDFVVGETVIFY